MDEMSIKTGTRVLVAGATGYIGGGVASRLRSAGYRVRGLTRDADRLVKAGVADEIAVAEATRPETLRGIMDGVDVLFSSIGIRSFDRRPTLWEVDRDANLHLLEEARRAGVRRVVFVSVLRGPEMAKMSPIAAAREEVVQAIQASGLPYTIYRPTGFFNDMAEIFVAARDQKRVLLLGSGHGIINPLSALDLGDEIARVLRDPKAPNLIRSVGGLEVLSHREVAELACRILGQPAQVIPVPQIWLRAAARLARPFNVNAYGLLAFFRFVAATRDMRGDVIGTRRLEDFFRGLARGLSIVEADRATPTRTAETAPSAAA